MRIAAGAGIVEIPAEPAVGDGFAFGIGGVPDFHGSKVGPVGIRVADALDHSHLAGFVEVAEFREIGVEADGVVELQNLVGRDADCRARPVIGVHAVRHNHVEAVIAAAHLDDDEDVIVGEFHRRTVEREGGARQEERRGAAGGKEEQALPEEFPARVECVVQHNW